VLNEKNQNAKKMYKVLSVCFRLNYNKTSSMMNLLFQDLVQGEAGCFWGARRGRT
jgi:hypothetical protein